MIALQWHGILLEWERCCRVPVAQTTNSLTPPMSQPDLTVKKYETISALQDLRCTCFYKAPTLADGSILDRFRSNRHAKDAELIQYSMMLYYGDLKFNPHAATLWNGCSQLCNSAEDFDCLPPQKVEIISPARAVLHPHIDCARTRVLHHRCAEYIFRIFGDFRSATAASFDHV